MKIEVFDGITFEVLADLLVQLCRRPLMLPHLHILAIEYDLAVVHDE